MNNKLADSAQLHSCALQLSTGELPAGWEIVSSSVHARVALHAQWQVYYKEFLPRSPLDGIKALVKGSRAASARRHADALLYAGIEAPENLAWGKLPSGSEYLFTRAAAGKGVTTWLQTELAKGSGAEALATRRLLLESLGVFIGRMHATGFLHGDLRPGNVVAELREGRFLFSLIDNERTVHKIPPPGRMLLRNLMQLNMLPPKVLSQTDRMRFFVSWRRQLRELSPIELKVLGAEAYHWAMRRMYDKGEL